MSLEKQKAFIIHCVFAFILLIMVYAGVKYVFPLLMPFVIGLIISMTFRKPIDLLTKKLGIKRTFSSIIILILFYACLFLVISLIGARFFQFISSLFNNLPSLYKETLQPALSAFTDQMSNRFPVIKVYLDEFINNIGQSIFTYLSNISSKVVTTVTGLAGQVPTLLIKVIFTIVSSFFFTIDYYKIGNFVLRQFGDKRRNIMLNLKDNVIGSLGIHSCLCLDYFHHFYRIISWLFYYRHSYSISDWTACCNHRCSSYFGDWSCFDSLVNHCLFHGGYQGRNWNDCFIHLYYSSSTDTGTQNHRTADRTSPHCNSYINVRRSTADGNFGTVYVADHSHHSG